LIFKFNCASVIYPLSATPMQQKSFSSLGFDRARKQTRRERFLVEMGKTVRRQMI